MLDFINKLEKNIRANHFPINTNVSEGLEVYTILCLLVNNIFQLIKYNCTKFEQLS